MNECQKLREHYKSLKIIKIIKFLKITKKKNRKNNWNDAHFERTEIFDRMCSLLIPHKVDQINL